MQESGIDFISNATRSPPASVHFPALLTLFFPNHKKFYLSDALPNGLMPPINPEVGVFPSPPSAFISKFNSEDVKFGDTGRDPPSNVSVPAAKPNPTGVCVCSFCFALFCPTFALVDLRPEGEPLGDPVSFSFKSLRNKSLCWPCGVSAALAEARVARAEVFPVATLTPTPPFPPARGVTLMIQFMTC